MDEHAHHCQACHCPSCGAEARATCLPERDHVVRWCEICYRVHRVESPRCQRRGDHGGPAPG